MDARDVCYCVRYQLPDQRWLTYQRLFRRREEAEREVARLRAVLPSGTWIALIIGV